MPRLPLRLRAPSLWQPPYDRVPVPVQRVPGVLQEGFRWRNDDGDEDGATWKAAQDTNATVALDTSIRLRTLIDTEVDPGPGAYTLYYRKTTDSTWLPVPVRTLGLTASGRNLYEGDQPFYGFVDTPWHLATRCTQDEIIGYVADRKAQGFNMLQIVALNVIPDVEPVSTKQNIYGKFPFTGNETPDITSPLIVGSATDDDGSADYDYWDHVRWTVDYIGKQGMYVNIVPMWHGYQGSSWRGYLDAAKATTYGTFIGTLLGGFPHVMWMLGGDNNPVGNVAQVPGGLSTADVVIPTNNMAAAITAQCVRPPLMTFHCDRLSSPTTWFWGQSWYNVYAAYSDRWTWDYVENEVDSIPTAPTHMVESYYDGRAALGLATPHLTREEVRGEMYWSYLCGAANSAYAHEFTCRMVPDWEDYVNVPSSTDIALLRRTIERLGAQPVFDTRTSTNAMLATGRGDGAVNVASVAASAVSKDRTYGVAYFLETRTPISVNLARFNKTSVALKWVHPGTGAETVIGTYGGTGTQAVTYPGGFVDALLIAEASGTDAVAPINKSVSDQFDGASTASWIEHDTDNVGTFTVIGGKLNVAITGTGNYDMSSTLSNAPKWLQLHQGDFDVTVRSDTVVTGSTAPQAFRGWNILAMAGPTGDHAFLSTYDTTTLTQRIDHGRRVGSTITHQYNATPGGGVPATLVLRLRRVGDVFTAYYGSSPYNVTSLGSQTWTGASAMTHLGVCVVTSGATWAADFEYFNVAGGEPVLGTATADPVYIAPSDNIAASGEATTTQLSAPSGKTTSSFSVGRMWDDENGTDLVDIVAPNQTWQEVYDIAFDTGDYGPADIWYDINTGRTSTETLLDLGAQVTVTTSFLNSREISDPDHFFQEGGRRIIQDVHCANFRITSTGGFPLTIRQCWMQRRGNSYLYCVHSPSSSPVHDIRIEYCDFDGEDEPSGAFAVYMPSNDYVDNDTVTTHCKVRGFQSGPHGVYGNTVEYCLISDTYYFPESHNTSASFRGGHTRVYRNRVRPGASGSSGINFYAEVSPGDDPEGYDFLYMIENMIHATEAEVTVGFPDEDDPSVLFSDPFVGMTRVCTGNIIDKRFSNPLNWVAPGNSVGSIVSGSGIAGNIHWDGTDADDGSDP